MKGVAASAAAVFAITMAGGPGIAVSLADSGGLRLGPGAGRDGGNTDGGRHGHRNRGQIPEVFDRRQDNRRYNDDRHDDDRHDDGPGAGRPGRGHGQGTGAGRGQSGGSGGQTGGSSRGTDTGQSTSVTASRGTSSVASSQPATASRGTVASVAPAAEISPVTTTDVSPATAPAATAPAAASGGGGSTLAGPGISTVPLLTPRVIFGDGRSPAFLPERLDERPGGQDVGPTVAGPLPATPSSRPLALSPPVLAPAVLPAPLTMISVPWPLSETPVTSIWGQAAPGWPAGLLFGIAGLLLAPLGGVWLGHRQARAAKTAAQLVSR